MRAERERRIVVVGTAMAPRERRERQISLRQLKALVSPHPSVVLVAVQPRSLVVLLVVHPQS